MTSDDINTNAFAAFLAALGATLAGVDEWPVEFRTSDEFLDILKEALQDWTMNLDTLSEAEKMMVLTLYLSLKEAVKSYKD
ncbi:MAG: hypothetical protein F4X97_11595 [Boseongicola sp. SB0662_bin_57]|nr:hypothetical protein [Boseongicola sp. SB0662_bin_57]